MPRQRSAKALQMDVHRDQIRWFLDSIDVRAKAIADATGHEEKERKLWEFVGAVSYASEEMRQHLAIIDNLAK